MIVVVVVMPRIFALFTFSPPTSIATTLVTYKYSTNIVLRKNNEIEEKEERMNQTPGFELHSPAGSRAWRANLTTQPFGLRARCWAFYAGDGLVVKPCGRYLFDMPCGGTFQVVMLCDGKFSAGSFLAGTTLADGKTKNGGKQRNCRFRLPGR